MDNQPIQTLERTPYKQVVVIRKDLKMRTGKSIAQGGHAILGGVIKELNGGFSLAEKPPVFDENGEYHLTLKKDEPLTIWLLGAFRKITVYVNSEEELLTVYDKAKEAGLPAVLITDNGWTEFNGVLTNTCISIGPAHEDDVNRVTGNLPLL